MGLGKLFGNITQAVIQTAIVPIDIVKDVLPGGGGFVDGESSTTAKRIDRIKEELTDAYDELDKD